MLTTRQDTGVQIASVPVTEQSFDELIQKEWLLTNSRGGFSSGTVLGCNTRRYHGLLTGTLNPPANRIMALSNLLEQIHFNGRCVELPHFEFDGTVICNGSAVQTEFTRDIGVHFKYAFDGVELTRSIYMLPDTDAVAVVYDFDEVPFPVDFSVRPLMGLRDFHALTRRHDGFQCESDNDWVSLTCTQGTPGRLFIRSESMQYFMDWHWWYNFLYREEQRRGMDCHEDLLSPGGFHAQVTESGQFILWATFGHADEDFSDMNYDLDMILDMLTERQRKALKPAKKDDAVTAALYMAAGQFTIERTLHDEHRESILAGYPWFLDWGRDAFIALEGLLLCTKRFDEAAGVLTTFAEAVDEGMIPNRFDDYGGTAHYNSIDASLWFIQACFAFLKAGGDEDIFRKQLLPAAMQIVTSYHNGTRFGIHADEDGLITGGDEQTQLTWMDAKCGDMTFTPRFGKAVEINALWYNAVKHLANYCKNNRNDAKQYYKEMADSISKSFRSLFWNEELGCLYDCIFPDGTPDASIRPNQIFAVSLPHSPLTKDKKIKVLKVVEKHLLTPYGLRTLSPQDPRYQARYEGGIFERDRAYHQGNVWPFLMGHFIDAWLDTHKTQKTAKQKCMKWLKPLLSHLVQDGCIGSISEVFDGDEPHRPGGAFAQAWSVSEVLRLYRKLS